MVESWSRRHLTLYLIGKRREKVHHVALELRPELRKPGYDDSIDSSDHPCVESTARTRPRNCCAVEPVSIVDLHTRGYLSEAANLK